jgi:hypothetical protein
MEKKKFLERKKKILEEKKIFLEGIKRIFLIT